MLEETDPKFPLPPCRICSAPGAGFHYGVNTCEACKGFFHRSLNHWSRYKCLNKGKCLIQHGQGKMCRLCRYQKCLEMGMSKSAIKTGRYNYKKKTDDILEVKKMTKELAKDSTVEMTPPPSRYVNPATVSQPFDSASQDSSLSSNMFDGSHISKQKTHFPLQSDDIHSKDSFNPIPTDHQNQSYGIPFDIGFNEDNVQGSTPGYLHRYSVSPDSFSQNTPESIVSASPPSARSSETSTPASPSMMLAASLSPPANSFIEMGRFQNLENSPTQLQPQLQLKSQFDSATVFNEENTKSSHSLESSLFPTSSSFPSIQIDQQQNETTHSVHDLIPKASSSSLASLASSNNINANESLTIDTSSSSKSDFLCSENCPSKMSPCTHWLSSVEFQNSFDLDNEVADSATWNVSDVEMLFQDLDKVVINLVDAHKKYINQFFEDIEIEELEKQQREHYEACKLRKQMFGNIRRLPDHEYDQLYGETGIDADNRGKTMRNFAKAMEDTIWAMVSFAMAIPGFSELSKEAKQNLIKYSRQEFCLLNLFKYVNLELKVYRGVETDWQCCLEMENSDFRQTLDSVFVFLRKFKKLNLTHEQCVTLRALVIMAPDRTSLADSKIISAIYDQLVKVLIYLLGKQFDRPMLVFAKIMCLITELRTKEEEVTEMFKKHNLIRYMPISDKPFIQLMYSGIYI